MVFTPPLICLSCFFLLISTATATATATAADTKPYTPTDRFFVNCGTSGNTTSLDGRNWDGDDRSKFSPYSTQSNDTSYISQTSEQGPSVELVPSKTARIFHSPFTYTFPVSTGPKFLRLYFYPATYTGVNISQSFFTVTAGGYTLLSNFSAYLTVTAAKPSLKREFIVYVREDTQWLNITFSPSNNSFAFVNGIEVVSMPDNLYMRGSNIPVPTFVGPSSLYPIENDSALELMYRLNMGGNEVGVNDDTGMFRSWENDGRYLFDGAPTSFTPHLDVSITYTAVTPNYTAPVTVYTTTRTMGNFSLHYNLTWSFLVDSGFYYLLRLHFCEIQQEITEKGERMFTILINNQTAKKEVDVIALSGGPKIPVFRDYVVACWNKQDLWLALTPFVEVKPKYYDAILNGLEIFKLNKPDGSLGGPNPEPVVIPTPQTDVDKKKRSSVSLTAVVGSVAGGIGVFAILALLIFWRRRKRKQWCKTDAKSSYDPISSASTKTSAATGSSLPSDLCRRFTISQIRLATNNFDDNFVVGQGGFGNVYKGLIDDGAIAVAIKRLKDSSRQGVTEFETEILMLSKLRHLHLVSLIGYCDDYGEMILVYEFMTRGTLRDHLYKTDNPPLSWKQRLQICIGSARGLHYLHTGAKCTIIHRDVKSTNILLDEKWVAKVSDFGLSKMGPTDLSQSHVSTVVKGSFGYLDPEYYRRQQVTEKSDVYSFGVVLFEVLCARPAIIPNLPKEQANLAEWARQCKRKGIVDQMVDPHLTGQIAPECLAKFVEVAYSCLRDRGIDRPAMNDVVWSLEFALQLQETAEKVAVTEEVISPSHPFLSRGEATTTDDDDAFSRSLELESRSKSSGSSMTSSNGLKPNMVFSELSNPDGR